MLEICEAYFKVKPGGNVDPRGDPHGELKNQNHLTTIGIDKIEKIVADVRNDFFNFVNADSGQMILVFQFSMGIPAGINVTTGLDFEICFAYFQQIMFLFVIS